MFRVGKKPPRYSHSSCALLLLLSLLSPLCAFFILYLLSHTISSLKLLVCFTLPFVVACLFFFIFISTLHFVAFVFFTCVRLAILILGRCWHNVHFNRTAAESRSYLKSRCARRRSEHVCMYVYLFYCCNMVKVQGYDLLVVTYYIRN